MNDRLDCSPPVEGQTAAQITGFQPGTAADVGAVGCRTQAVVVVVVKG